MFSHVVLLNRADWKASWNVVWIVLTVWSEPWRADTAAMDMDVAATVDMGAADTEVVTEEDTATTVTTTTAMELDDRTAGVEPLASTAAPTTATVTGTTEITTKRKEGTATAEVHVMSQQGF